MINIHLNSDKKTTLELRHRKCRDKHECDRIKAILLSDEGWSCVMISQALRNHPDKVWRTGVAGNIHNVLAVTLEHTTDLNGDGTPDADNNGDGRFDEDPCGDRANDAASGIYLIDDDVDEISNIESDDESTTINDAPPVSGETVRLQTQVRLRGAL